MKLASWLVGVSILGVAGTAVGQVPPARYRVIDLGHLGSAQAYAMHVSEEGMVVGMAAAPSTQDFHAVVWDNDGVAEVPLLPGRTQGVAFDAGAGGRVVGTSFSLGELNERAFGYHDGVLDDLGAFQAHATGAGGAIAGSLAIAVPGQGLVDHACILSPGETVPADLGTLGGLSSRALAMSGHAQPMIVGVSQIAGNAASHATLWLAGVPRDLGTLGGMHSCANAVNGARQIVGVADLASGVPHAVLFNVDVAGNVSERIDLGAFPAGQSAANDINDAGDVVGSSDSRAFVSWAGRMRDLNAMIPSNSGWRLESATSINAVGQIVGRGYHNGLPLAFLLEPATTCPAEFNLDGVVNSQDFFDYLVEFFENTPAGDFNADTIVNSQDFFDFLTAFFSGC
jgi:uncharacterized membrane protein